MGSPASVDSTRAPSSVFEERGHRRQAIRAAPLEEPELVADGVSVGHRQMEVEPTTGADELIPLRVNGGALSPLGAGKVVIDVA